MACQEPHTMSEPDERWRARPAGVPNLKGQPRGLDGRLDRVVRRFRKLSRLSTVASGNISAWRRPARGRRGRRGELKGELELEAERRIGRCPAGGCMRAAWRCEAVSAG